jgi:hypothetical protein
VAAFCLPLFEIAFVIVRFDHVARFIVNANHGVPIRLAKLARFFQNSAHMKTASLPLRNLMNRPPLRGFLLIPFVLACFALSPQARAVCQEGCLTRQNTVLGDDALLNNTGPNNTAVGFDALLSNTTGADNTANGGRALFSNTTGNENTAIGFDALNLNGTGSNNTATGVFALAINNNGSNNTADGFSALYHNILGKSNTAIGNLALYKNTTGDGNIALGADAGRSLTTGSYNIDIGNPGVRAEEGSIRIGTEGRQTNTFIAGIAGVTVAGGVEVIIDTSGHLGTVVSSARFKDEIKPMDKASEAILSLKPVTFRYKHELDPKGIPQFGLVAEQVEKVNPDLVARDADRKAYTVRYEAVNAMLLNEFLKEHRTVQELKFAAAKQEATIAHQQEQIEALTSGLEKVSAQLETSKPAPQMVNNNQ